MSDAIWRRDWYDRIRLSGNRNRSGNLCRSDHSGDCWDARLRDREDPLQQRLADFAARGDVASLEQIELSQPLTERVIYPSARKIGEVAHQFHPAKRASEHRAPLELAGNPRGLEPATFWALADHAGGRYWRFPALYLWDW